MILRYCHLSRFPRVFKAMTGVDVPELPDA